MDSETGVENNEMLLFREGESEEEDSRVDVVDVA